MPRTVQIPVFRHTVADQMAGHRERISERIRIELARRGEQPTDLAYRIKVHPRTVENWLSPDPEKATTPQGANLKAIADYFEIPIEELNPDLELVEKTFRDQMDRIEATVKKIVADLATTQDAVVGLDARLTKELRAIGRKLDTSAKESRRRTGG